MNNITDGFEKIVVETDGDNPEIIAEITDDEINVADGFRVRLTPKKKSRD